MPIFICDFSIDACFEEGYIILTNGNEFNSIDLSEPPQAPLSDVSSLSKSLSI